MRLSARSLTPMGVVSGVRDSCDSPRTGPKPRPASQKPETAATLAPITTAAKSVMARRLSIWMTLDASGYLAVGMTNSAPLPMLSGQRCMTLFCLV